MLSPSILLPPSVYSPELPEIPDPTAPRIRRTNSYEVAFHFARLKQGLRQVLQPIWLVFDSYETATSFGIDYRLNAANLPREATGRLDVIVEKAGATQAPGDQGS